MEYWILIFISFGFFAFSLWMFYFMIEEFRGGDKVIATLPALAGFFSLTGSIIFLIFFLLHP